jgi:hypothetical protein
MDFAELARRARDPAAAPLTKAERAALNAYELAGGEELHRAAEIAGLAVLAGLPDLMAQAIELPMAEARRLLVNERAARDEALPTSTWNPTGDAPKATMPDPAAIYGARAEQAARGRVGQRAAPGDALDAAAIYSRRAGQ